MGRSLQCLALALAFAGCGRDTGELGPDGGGPGPGGDGMGPGDMMAGSPTAAELLAAIARPSGRSERSRSERNRNERSGIGRGLLMAHARRCR